MLQNRTACAMRNQITSISPLPLLVSIIPAHVYRKQFPEKIKHAFHAAEHEPEIRSIRARQAKE